MPYCDPCERWFDQWSSYRQHMNMSSSHNWCEDCDKDFDSWPALRQHYIQSSRHDFCRECNTLFDDQSSLIEHCLEEHDYCDRCDKFFRNATGLHEHNRQSHHYCVECRRVFNSESNLYSHMNSSIHRPKNVSCAFRHLGCTQWFVSKSAMILHLESGTCPSGVDRKKVKQWVVANDRNRDITVQPRLLTDTEYIATPRSWNRAIQMWECVLCHRTFATLDSLNSHLASPRHQEKIFRCPLSTCQMKFSTLSGLCQHVESEKCGILRFRVVRESMDRLLEGVNRLRIQGKQEVDLLGRWCTENEIKVSYVLKVRDDWVAPVQLPYADEAARS